MLEFRNLDDRTRQLMLAEVEHDIANGLYQSSYFNERGIELWPSLLRAAVASGNDASLAQAIRANGCLKAKGIRNTKNGPVAYSIPVNAHHTVAEGNFSRFYIRALCVRAIEDGHGKIIGYRAMQVMKPRPGSNEMIGQTFDAAAVLADLRATMASDPALGMPPGPNSGILAHLP